MLIALIPVVWLALAAFVVLMCRCAARSDTTLSEALSRAEVPVTPAAPVAAHPTAEHSLRAARLRAAPTMRVRDGRGTLIAR